MKVLLALDMDDVKKRVIDYGLKDRVDADEWTRVLLVRELIEVAVWDLVLESVQMRMMSR
jgi:hypothetical protein